MILQATLQANLDALKVYLPSIYEDFKDYTPKNTWVIIDKNGKPNLFNNDKCVYEEGAREFASQQVNQFIEFPDICSTDIPVEDNLLDRFEHARVLEKINQKTKSENPIRYRHLMNEDRLDLLFMLGVGLGYQIEELFKQKKIQNLILCEPSRDVFYAMLHCIELKPIIESCRSLGGVVSLTVGGSALDPVNSLHQFFRDNGHAFTGRFYVYKHYNSTTNDESVKKLQELAYRLVFGWGFMEDEVISIKHTLVNLQAGRKVCKAKSEFTNSHPERQVFIAANGPSLDYSMDFLRSNQDDLIIVSCGTTLKALLKNNITPDIHVEMERTKYLIEYVEAIEKQQENSSVKLKYIQLVTLNTVHPEILAKFKSPLLLTKSADAGGVLISDLDKLGMYAIAKYANPTCANAAMELITLLGFKEIYLVGTDFGYVSKEHHHSKDSIYYDEESSLKDSSDAQMSDKLKRKGNFREAVFTNSIFDSTRINLEFTLESNPDVNVYNTADGSYIQLTEPMRIENIQLPSHNEDKSIFLDKLLADAFGNKQLELGNIVRTMKDKAYLLKVTLEQLILKMDKKVNSREELADIFLDQYRLLKELYKCDEYKFNYWLIQGTFRYHQTVIMANSYLYGDLNERNKFMNYCLNEFKAHLEYLYKDFTTTCSSDLSATL